MKELYSRKIVIFFTGVFIGFLILFQLRSFTYVEEIFMRDRNPNIFREIQILKNVISRFGREKDELRQQLSDIRSKTTALKALSEEFVKYELLTGEKSVHGQGIRIIIPVQVDEAWFIDIQNELVSAGAEAVAINGSRIVPGRTGFRVIPPNKLLIGNTVVKSPYTIEAIGDSEFLAKSMLVQGSTISRLQKLLKGKEIILKKEEDIILSGGNTRE